MNKITRMLATIKKGGFFSWMVSAIFFLSLSTQANHAQLPSQPQHEPRVLVLISGAYGRPGIEQFNAGLLEGWDSLGYSSTQISMHYLDLNQDPDPHYQHQLAQWIIAKEQGTTFDYIVLVQQDAADFFFSFLPHLSPDALLVSAFFTLDYDTLTKHNRSGLSMSHALDHRNTLDTALALFPETKNVLVVSGATPSDTQPLDAIQQDASRWPSLNFEYTDKLPYPVLLNKLTHLPPDTVVLRSSYGADINGEPGNLTPIEIGQALTAASNAPNFVLYYTAIGGLPVVGGHVVVPKIVGQSIITQALTLSKDALSVRNVTIPLKSTPIYDIKVINKWGGKITALPEDTIKLNTPRSFWQEYGVTLLVSALITLFMGAVVFSLLIERRNRIRTTEDLEVSKTQLLTNLEYSPHVAVQWFDQDGNVRYWNPASERLYGWRAEEAVGRNITDLFLSSDCMQGYFDKLNNIKHKGEALAPYEVSIVCKSGEERIVLTTSFVIPMGAGEMGFASMDLDVTERYHTQNHLSLLASVFEHASEGIVICSSDRIIEEVNDAFCQLSGFSREELIGQKPDLLYYQISNENDSMSINHVLQKSLSEKGHWSGEMVHRRKNGHLFTSLVTINTVVDSQGQNHRYIALLSDITSLKQHQQRLERMAHYDSVTDLPNRVMLAERLQQAILQTSRHKGEKLALVYIDLDGFKAVNDMHGHQTGDALLIELSKRMRQTLRNTDTLARLGGDEFAAVLTNLKENSDCERALNTLLDAVAKPVRINGLELRVSASIGVVFQGGDQSDADADADADPDQLLRQADQAMYKAKATGKNRYCFFDDTQHRLERTRQEDLLRLRQALDHNEFELYYQPKVNLSSGKIIGVEALIRWNHPEKGLIPPGLFLPLLTHHPLSVDIGYWVIETALAQITAFKTMGLAIPISVNIDGFQMSQPDFIDKIKAILLHYPDHDRNTLEFEVLESSALEDIDQIISIIGQCTDMGISFALDDFGTGYSSLNYLKRLPVQTLKIDQSFVRNMLDNPDDLAIIQGILGLAHAFRRHVIAEGVETEEHSQILHTMGCDVIQGYVIAKPMPITQFIPWIEEWASSFKLHRYCS